MKANWCVIPLAVLGGFSLLGRVLDRPWPPETRLKEARAAGTGIVELEFVLPAGVPCHPRMHIELRGGGSEPMAPLIARFLPGQSRVVFDAVPVRQSFVVKVSAGSTPLDMRRIDGPGKHDAVVVHRLEFPKETPFLVGRATDSCGEPLSHVSVGLIRCEQGIVGSATMTTSDGSFAIALRDPLLEARPVSSRAPGGRSRGGVDGGAIRPRHERATEPER